LYFLHHYIQRGHNIKDLLELSHAEKIFMIESMVLFYEEESKRWGKNEQSD
jgi:hypothetical protein